MRSSWEGGEPDKVRCGSISWTVDLNRTVGPTLSSEFCCAAGSGAFWGPSTETMQTHWVRQEVKLDM